MSFRRVLSTSVRFAAAYPRSSQRLPTLLFPQYRTYASKVVKVPEMAESITEGTLKQFSKGVGDYVELDEEIATIETDKIDISVNAPEAGTIAELLVKEEDTVTVGQDLIKLELGGAPPEGKKEETAKEEPKEPAPKEQETASQPEPSKQETKPEPPKQESKPQPPPQQEKKPAPPKEESKKTESPFGNREERRVGLDFPRAVCRPADLVLPGENEPHASAHCRASQTVPEYRRLAHHLQRG